ncbi:hypothetical protein LCGC14_3081940, partial [marine sediment metagenome]
MLIEFGKLVPNDYNPRKLFRSALLEELKKSIKNYGLIEPLVVRPINKNKYEVICGMRRYYALQDLGVEEIECSVKEIDDKDAIDLAFMENLQRENLTPIEEAKMFLTRLKMFPEYQKLSDSSSNFRYNSELIKKLSKLYSISEGTIRNRLSLLILPEELQNNVENNEITYNQHGIRLYYGSRFTIILNNTIEHNSMHGIYVYQDCEYTDILNNRISFNGQDGIQMLLRSHGFIQYNILDSNTNYGMYIRNAYFRSSH